MNNIIDIDEMVKNQLGGLTVFKFFINELKTIINRHQFSKLVTNGNLASVIQDYAGYIAAPIATPIALTPQTKEYPIGKFLNIDIDVYVDPYMRWDDNRIIFSTDLKIARKRKINKIFNQQENSPLDKYIIVVKDSNGILI